MKNAFLSTNINIYIIGINTKYNMTQAGKHITFRDQIN